jgi:SAM-dependent methyltransferase
VSVDPLAVAGFGLDGLAERYERARPSYPPEAVDLLVAELGIGPGRRVLDLAAGTGKLTRLLVPFGADLVAVEPLGAMRDQLAAAAPAIEALAGSAESVPLPDASVDAVTVAQAFHWFDAPTALDELARVLRAGGGLALLWNERDDSVPWVAELSRIMRWSASMPYDPATDWAAVVASSGHFTPLRSASIKHVQVLDVALLVDRVASSSYIAAMEPRAQQAILDEVRALVADFSEPFELPYLCDVHWCHRRSSSPS